MNTKFFNTFIGLLLVFVISSTSLAEEFKNDTNSAIVIHDSQLVFSRTIRQEHDFEKILKEIDSLNILVEFPEHETKSYAYEVLMYYSEYYSINPLVILSFLEKENGIFSKSSLSDVELEHVAGMRDSKHQGFANQIKWLTSTLAESYYSYKYDVPTHEKMDTQLNPGSFAIQNILFSTNSRTQDDNDKLTLETNSFVKIYQQFRNPQEDVFWQSSQDTKASSQPYMVLPWASGKSMHFTGGPHNYWGTSTAQPWSSLDFAPEGGSGCNWTSYTRVTPTRSGDVFYATNALVKINHAQDITEAPWETRYFHLRSIRVSNGNYVSTNTTLGYPSCERGKASGIHLHFAFAYDGEFVKAHGKYFSGWRIEETTHYNGTMSKGRHTVTADKVKSDDNKITN